jgi:hypothetical protein
MEAALLSPRPALIEAVVDAEARPARPHELKIQEIAMKERANEDMESCIDACTDCHRVCLETLTTCLRLGGKHAAAEHLRLLLDCAEICQTSTDFMLRGSAHHRLTCGTCAKLCRACESSCRQLGGAEMQPCIAACARCADSCERMAGAAMER